MKKIINKKTLAGYLILGGMGVGLIVLMVGGWQKKTKNFEVDLTPNQNSVYTSKLEALRARMKGNEKPTRGYESAFQSQIPTTPTPSVGSEQNIVPTPEPPAREAQAAGALIQAQQQAQQIARRNTSQEISDDNYQRVEKAIKSVYGNAPKKIENKQNVEPQMSEKEQRKAMMEQSWGQVGRNDALADPSRNFRGVIHQSQKVKSGSIALLRTTQSITAGNIVIPENTLLSGVVSIGRGRLNISINSVRVDKEIIPIHLTVYGTDGIAGIPVKADEVGRELNGEATEEVVRQVGNAVGRTGAVGRTIGSIFLGTARTAKREKEREVLLIDNQMIIFKIN